MSTGEEGILDRLYTPDGATLAMNWLWENVSHLQSQLATAAPVAMYAAAHAATRFIPASEGFQMTGHDAEFMGTASAFCEAMGHNTNPEGASQGGGALLASVLMAIARQLMEKMAEELLNK